MLVRRYQNLIRYHRNWYAYLAHKFFSQRSEPLRLVTKKGLAITVPPELIFTYKECFLDTTYLKGFPEAVNLGSGSTVIDISANAGYFSLFMFEHFPEVQVFAFEPVPANFKLLQQYKQQFPHLAWTVIPAAVGGKSGTLELHYEGPDQFTTAASKFKSEEGTHTIEVSATTLSDIQTQFGLKQIDFLKLDCEGAEYEILYGLTPDQLSRIKYVAVETHQGSAKDQSGQALEEYLRNHAFNTWSKGSKIWAQRR